MESSTFRILVIVPTLNSSHQAINLIDSLRAQTYTNWRCIFIDGYSSPYHLDYLKKIIFGDLRFEIFSQNSFSQGIFGAMNHGIDLSYEDDWLLFSGTDDYLASDTIFEDFYCNFTCYKSMAPLLLIGSASYFTPGIDLVTRTSSFGESFLMSRELFRKRLFLGNCPPHQATLFNPIIFHQYKLRYNERLSIAADLHLYLRISAIPDFICLVVNTTIVMMGDKGVSSKNHATRLKEVYLSYVFGFGMIWFIPFTLRYLKKILFR